MSYKSLINSTRVFTDPGFVTVSTTLTSSFSIPVSAITTFTINVASTLDFKSEGGYITINSVVFYYKAKTNISFTNVTYISGNKATAFNTNDTVTQTYNSPNNVNPTDTGLAGWYIDGYSNQAGLRVSDTPVIQPGIIRFTPTAGFQGCISVDGGPSWVTFNSTEGPAGEPGAVNSMLTYEYLAVPPAYIPASNIGNIIPTSSLSTEIVDGVAPSIKLRPIVAGKQTVNGQTFDSAIITNDTSIIINPVGLPYTWDLTAGSVSSLNPTGPTSLYKYGNTERWQVDPTAVSLGSIGIGQAVCTVMSGSSIYVTPFIYSAHTDLNQRAIGINKGFVGIVCSLSSPDLMGNVYAEICSSGIVPVKMSSLSSAISGLSKSSSGTIANSGLPCILNSDGYGMLCDNVELVTDRYWFEIGYFAQYGTGVASSGSFVLVKINQQFIRPIGA